MTNAEVLIALQAFHDEIEAIEKIFDENGRMPSKQVGEEQEMFKALKEKLEAEYDRMATTKGQASLSDVERNFYMPAVDQGWRNLSPVRSNSRADRKLLDALVSASHYMSYWMHNLNQAQT
jgi:predicted house-cleaning noncanonical NTP pyrophosphatase (MazG superfamily)